LNIYILSKIRFFCSPNLSLQIFTGILFLFCYTYSDAACIPKETL